MAGNVGQLICEIPRFPRRVEQIDNKSNESAIKTRVIGLGVGLRYAFLYAMKGSNASLRRGRAGGVVFERRDKTIDR